jgi:signal transduction histidine kinase
MHPKPLNLNQLVEEVVDLYRSIDRQAVIAIELEPALPLVEGDVGRLRQVLNNLVKNALEATEETAPPSIEISTRWVEEASHGFIELRIEDRGAGIPQALLNQLFEPYVTNKPKGTGLGLAIVKKIVEEHGGVVWLENNVKRPGACAVIRLPVAAYQVTACALPAQASRNAL